MGVDNQGRPGGGKKVGGGGGESVRGDTDVKRTRRNRMKNVAYFNSVSSITIYDVLKTFRIPEDNGNCYIAIAILKKICVSFRNE